MIIRICTEDVNPVETRRLLNRFFNCYTIHRGDGSWNGTEEPSITIDLAILEGGTPADRMLALATECAGEIKIQNHQEAVLLQVIDSINTLI